MYSLEHNTWYLHTKVLLCVAPKIPGRATLRDCGNVLTTACFHRANDVSHETFRKICTYVHVAVVFSFYLRTVHINIGN